MNAAVWAGLIERLVPEHRVTTIELPGHGHSPFVAGLDSLERWAEACLEVAPERAAWIGWSLGSQVCLQAALMAPARVSRLVAVAGSPRFLKADDWPYAVARGTMQGFADTLKQDPHLTLERFLALQVRGSDQARFVLRELRDDLRRRPEPNPEALDKGLEILRGTDLRERLHELACPVLWLLGERDTLTPAGVAEGLRTLIPSAQVEVLTGAAHAPFLSHADEAIELLQAFLDRL
jgi:pimeloyl-[acyl-carrier protein] methyl ester esterase